MAVLVNGLCFYTLLWTLPFGRVFLLEIHCSCTFLTRMVLGSAARYPSIAYGIHNWYLMFVSKRVLFLVR